ncbi:hypothetical protein HAX54_020065, partial [Datura stramonium]|nr:hypothetical protein [Datura stramonium]
GGALKKISAKLTEIIAEATTFNDSQHTVLDSTQEEPHLAGRIEPLLVDVVVEELDKSEDVMRNAILELWRIGPYIRHFSTMFLVGNLEIEPSKPMQKCVDEEQHLESKLRSMV